MILLNRKKILYIISCIIISVVFFDYTNIPHETIETSSTPISNHTVVLDAGHGLPDGGAESKDGTYEYEKETLDNIDLLLEKHKDYEEVEAKKVKQKCKRKV